MKLTLLDKVQKGVCSTFDEANVDILLLAPITMQHGREDALHGHGRGSYRKRPATPFSERLCARHKGLAFSKHIAAVHEQALAFARQTQATAGAVEEPDSQGRFQLAYTARQCRLREVHFSRRSGHAAGVVDRNKRAQLPEIRIRDHRWRQYA
jgi:hypothetical protein